MSTISFGEFSREVVSVYRTIRARLTWQKMRQVLREVGALPGVATVADLTPETVARFIESRAGGSPNTTAGMLGYLSAACSYAVRRGYLSANPLATRRGWVKRRKPAGKRHHSRAEVVRVLEHLRGLATDWEGRRLFALASTWAYCGLRRDEALRLKVADVDLDRGFIFVRPNGRDLKTEGSEAPVPIPAALAGILADWLPRSGSEWAFPGTRKVGPWTGGQAGKRAGDRLRLAGEAVGVAGLTPRSLRHSLATHLVGHWGLTPKQNQMILRHTVESTQDHYVHPDLANLRLLVRDFDFSDRKAPSPTASGRRRVLPRKRLRPGRRLAG